MSNTIHHHPSKSNSWVLQLLLVVIALAGLAISIYAMHMVRLTMDQVAEFSQQNEAFQQQTIQQLKEQQSKTTELTKAVGGIKAVELTGAAQSATNATAANEPQQRSSTVWIPNESIEGNETRLESELEVLADRLKVQYGAQVEALHIAAMIKAQLRQYAAAQGLWQECVKLSPDDEIYYSNLATITIEQGENTRALEVLQQAKDRGLSSFDILHHRGVALTKLGRLAEAIEVFQQALEIQPDSAGGWLMLGQARLELGDAESAEAAFRKALQLGSESPSLWIGLGNASVRQGKRDEAKEFLDRYQQIKDADTLTGIERYQALSGREIRNTALTAFRDAALFFSKQKDFLESERLLQLCLTIDARNRDILQILADLYFKNGKIAEERTVRHKVIELAGATFQDYVNLAKTYAILRDRNGAEAILKSSVAAFPDSVQAYAALSQFHLETQNYLTARWYAQQSIERHPSAEGFRFLANICDKMKDSNGATQARTLAAQLEKKNP